MPVCPKTPNSCRSLFPFSQPLQKTFLPSIHPGSHRYKHRVLVMLRQALAPLGGFAFGKRLKKWDIHGDIPAALATGKVSSISTSVRTNYTVSIAKALRSEKYLLFCNSWVVQDLICSMLILTVPHVSSAAGSRSLYVLEPLLHRGKQPLKNPSLHNWVGENK